MHFDDGLLESLHQGAFEAPLWGDFLRRLRISGRADLALLVLRPAGTSELMELAEGNGPTAAIGRLLVGGTMREGRGYALEDLLEMVDPDHREEVRVALRAGRIWALRAIRIVEPGGMEGWLVCAGGRSLGSSAGALLLALAPHLGIAVRNFAALQREQFRSAMTSEAFSRLRIGWLTLDAQCRIVETAENVEQMFQWGTLLRRGRYDRLIPASPEVDRLLTAFVRDAAAGGDARPLALNLSRDPWVDMLVAPLQGKEIPGHRTAAAIVYVSGDRRSQSDRCEQLVDLFGLLPSEARLAWMLAQATSIAQAADALGLTIETARNYSKKIYAKTGARGQADLVRIVMTSVLALN